jgi:hypothetical protein
MNELAESLAFLHQNDMKVILVVGQSLDITTDFNVIKVIISFTYSFKNRRSNF